MSGFTYYSHGAVSGLSRANGTATGYGYDGAQRLSGMVQFLAGTAHDATWGYGRNPAGGIASVARDNNAYAWTGHYATTRAYTTNGLNQYSAAGGTSLTYDANGNLTASGSSTYVYDIENRLVSATGGVVLAYDPLGRLHQVSSTAGPTTAFLYDGDALIAEYVSGVMTRRYVHNVGADVPLLSYQGATLSLPSYLHADHQGSIVAISDASGNGAINSYDEYGIPGATNTGRFQYTGQAWLPELGMYYYKARIYSATLGRFLQTDPIGYRGGMNAYAYVRNNPVNFRDPLGLCSFTLMGHYEAPQGPDGRPSGPWDLKYTFVEQNTACESSYTSMVTPAALTEFGWANMDGDGDRQDSCRLDPGPVNFSGYLMATPAGPGHIGGTFYNMATGQRGTVATGSGYTFGLAGGMYSINATFNNIASFTQGFEFSYAFGFGAGGDITIYSLDQQFIAIGQISSGFSPPFGIAKASMDGGTIRSVNGHRC